LAKSESILPQIQGKVLGSKWDYVGFYVYHIGWIRITHRAQALDVGLISCNNYFIVEFLSVGDQRKRRKERKKY